VVEMAAENILSGCIWGFGCSSFIWSQRVVPVNSIRPSHEFEKKFGIPEHAHLCCFGSSGFVTPGIQLQEFRQTKLAS